MSNCNGNISITFRLEPDQESDRLAMAALQRWYQRGHKLNINTDSFDFFSLQLHKDIYLSGLFLSLLEPELVKCFARNLQVSNLTSDFLCNTLKKHLIMPDVGKPATSSLNLLASDELADRIADQLSPFFTALGEKAYDSEPSEQLQNQMSVLQRQLAEQGLLLKRQAQLLDQLTAGGSDISQGKTPTGNDVSQTQDLHDLSKTAAKVRKVRAKGVF
ncbi:hypothetical protein ACR9GP_22845 [Enterobacter ludwigii]